MAMSDTQVMATVRLLTNFRNQEKLQLDTFHDYMRGKQPYTVVPNGTPPEVRKLAEMSRVNVIKLALDVPAQSLFVDGYRPARASENSPAWAAWQANKMDARQTGVHRATLGYGAGYVRVTPGSPQPVIRGVSPRKMTAAYQDDDDDWPEFALEWRRERQPGRPRWWLYDSTTRYGIEGDKVESREAHGFDVTPVVRFRNIDDLDDVLVGEIEPLIPIQDQIDFTTFGLLVAQHFGAFRQRYILGWLAADEQERLKASAANLWTFEDDDVKVGEFGQTDLGGYLESREASTQNLATISQTPPHHLLGKLVNLSAEALVAAESGQRRKINERETLFGESWEQVFTLVAMAQGREPDDTAEVRWRDTEARALGATVDALGKMAKLLGIPPRGLWERIPNVTEAEILQWESLAAEDPVAAFDATLQRQMDQAMGDFAGV